MDIEGSEILSPEVSRDHSVLSGVKHLSIGFARSKTPVRAIRCVKGAFYGICPLNKRPRRSPHAVLYILLSYHSSCWNWDHLSRKNTRSSMPYVGL